MKKHHVIRCRYILSKERLMVRIVLLILGAVTVYGFFMLHKESVPFKQAVQDFLHYAYLAFIQPAYSHHTTLAAIFHALGITLALAFLTTCIGTAAAFFLAIGAARNISPPPLSSAILAVTALIRSVPTIIWVLVFSVTVNIGSDAAVLGMAVHSIAYLTKGFSESFEQISSGTIEALHSCGAGISGIITQAVLPSSRTALISWIFFRFEINFVNAVVIGAAAGSGGIGYHLFMAGNLYFDIHEVGFFTYTIFSAAVLLEFLSHHVRKKIG
ncbi:MAG: PhnE/PtxC family ABC transporter permease [Treponema sp.]